MFREGSQEAQTQTGIGDEQAVLPPWKTADSRNEPEENAHRGHMRRPVRQMTVVALPHAACFVADETPEPQDGTDQESPGHALIEHHHAPLERTPPPPTHPPTGRTLGT